MATPKTNSGKKKHGAGVKISQNARAREGEVSLKDVLRSNGEEHLYDDIMHLVEYAEDDPPLIFGWRFVREFVLAIKDAYNQAADGGTAVPDPPFPMPDPLTKEAFMAALLNYGRVGRVVPYTDHPVLTDKSRCLGHHQI